jgi:pimeloyl-ACP methyl ester carboxylesterase
MIRPEPSRSRGWQEAQPTAPAITERRASYAGYRTRQLEVQGSGPAIVLLHGFAHFADSWRLVLGRAHAAGRRAVAVDLPGFGAADPFRPGPLLPQLDIFITDLIVQHADGGSVVLVGNSLGGLAAVRAAEAERRLPVRGLVALDAAGFGWNAVVSALTVGNLRLFGPLAALPAPAGVRSRCAAVVAARLLYGRRRAVDRDEVRRLSEQLTDPLAARAVYRLGIRVLAEVNAIDPIREIACPTVIMHGRRDRIIPVRAALQLHAAIPGARLIVAQHAGHCPQLDAPARVAAAAFELAGATDTGRERPA